MYATTDITETTNKDTSTIYVHFDYFLYLF